MEDKKIKHLYCHNCKCETDQEIIFNDSTLDINEIIGYNEAGVKGQNCFAIVAHIYEITKCCGCKKKQYQRIRKKQSHGKGSRPSQISQYKSPRVSQMATKFKFI